MSDPPGGYNPYGNGTQPRDGYNTQDGGYVDNQNNTPQRQYVRNQNTAGNELNYNTGGRQMLQSQASNPGGTYRPPNSGKGGRPISMYSAYSINDAAIGGNMGNRTRSMHSVGTNKSAHSIASIKSERYAEHDRRERHEKLNKTSLGAGARTYRMAIIVAIFGAIFIAAGLTCIILQFSQRIVIQDQMEFIGPCLLAVGVFICGVAVYLYYQARRRSTLTRKQIRFKAAGAHNVSAINLTYEPQLNDLVSGKATPGNRTPLTMSGLATPKVIGGGYVTPNGTVQRGNVFTYGGEGNKTPTTPGAISVGLSGGVASRSQHNLAGSGAYLHGSAASRAQQKRTAYPADMPSFAAPGVDDDKGQDGMPRAPPLQMDYAHDIPNLPPGDPINSTFDSTNEYSYQSNTRAAPQDLSYAPQYDQGYAPQYDDQGPNYAPSSQGPTYAPPTDQGPAYAPPSKQGPIYAPPADQSFASTADSATGDQRRFRKREVRGAGARPGAGQVVVQDSKESEF